MNWRIVLSMILGNIPGVVLAITLLEYISHKQALYTEILTYSMGWMLIITALSIFFHNRLRLKRPLKAQQGIPNSEKFFSL